MKPEINRFNNINLFDIYGNNENNYPVDPSKTKQNLVRFFICERGSANS